MRKTKKKSNKKQSCGPRFLRETSKLVNDDHRTQLNNTKITVTPENNASMLYKKKCTYNTQETVFEKALQSPTAVQ